MDFLNNKHKDIYLELIENSNVNPNDVERKVLFYIISGNDDLFKKKSSVYDFDEGLILIALIVLLLIFALLLRL